MLEILPEQFKKSHMTGYELTFSSLIKLFVKGISTKYFIPAPD